MNTPLVSVIMGAYNAERCIERSVFSMLNQDYENIEFIICDDGSTDNTLLILEKLATQDTRITVLRNEKNCGLAATLNNCIRVANGKYIARMDADDICLPERISVQVEYLEHTLECAMAGAAVELLGDNGVWGMRHMKPVPSKTDLCINNAFCHPTMMMRKEMLMDVGGYLDSKLTRRCEDYELWCRCYAKGYIGHNINKVLLTYTEATSDYRKRKIKTRLNNFRVRLHCYKEMKVPFYMYIFALKPLLSIFIPQSLLIKYAANNAKKGV